MRNFVQNCNIILQKKDLKRGKGKRRVWKF